MLFMSAALASGALVYGEWSYLITTEAVSGASVVTITSYEGAGGRAVIPPEINGMPVRTVGSGLYALDKFNASKLTGIVIPDSVTTIDKYAFWQCYALASVTLGNGVKTTGYGSFAYCNALASIVLPDSLTTLGDYTFYSAKTLTTVTLGSGLKTIGVAAFSDSPLLTGIVIPNGVTSIGNYAFNNDTSLSSVVIPNSVITIGSYAFGNCDSLASIVIPDSVTSIGQDAFAQSLNLSSVTLGRGLLSIGDRAFWLCDGLTSMRLPDSLKSIPYRLFYDCANLASVTVGMGVTGVGDQAFDLCPKLSSVVFCGNAPVASGTTQNVFGSSNPQICFFPGTSGWGTFFGGRATAVFAPVASQSGFTGADQFTFAWSGSGQVPMTVQRSVSLGAGSWETVAGGITNRVFVDTNPPAGSAYYRSVLP